MLRLTNIRLNLSQPLSQQHRSQLLQISTLQGDKIKETVNPSKYIDSHNLRWEEQFHIPYFSGDSYLFETYVKDNSHREDDSTFHGKIVVIFHKNDGEWDAYDSYNILVGKLYANIAADVFSIAKNLIKSRKDLTKVSDSQRREKKKVLRILSLVVRAPKLNIKRGHVVLQIGDQKIKTPEIRSKGGELVFIEPRQIQLDDFNKMLQMKIFTQASLGQTPAAQAFITINEQQKSKRAVLLKDTFQIGEIYIQFRVYFKDLISTTNYVQNIDKRYQNNIQQQIQKSLKPGHRSISPLPVRFPSLDNYNFFTISHQNSSRVSKTNSKVDKSLLSSDSIKKNPSVLNQNNNIVFPKEKRFMSIQEKQNEKISYLSALQRSLEFRGIGAQYRGASFGLGEKTDFTKGKFAPGVGNYKLPSIWDRY